MIFSAKIVPIKTAGQATDGKHTRFLCRISEARTDTHSEYVILIAFALQQCLPERTSLLL